jgi:site-specific DNA recombinase
MNNAVIVYARVSTTKQDLSPDVQVEACRAWAEARGYQVAGVYVERGVSGGAALADRPVLLEALAALRPARARALVVAKRDRLARDVMNAALAESIAAKSGARIESADGVGAGDDAAAKLMRTMIDAFAEFERAQIAARVKATKGAQRAQGRSAGSVMLGKVRVQTEAGVRQVDADNAEARMVRRAGELLLSGVSVRQVAETLTTEGYRTRTGGPIHTTTVQRMKGRT